jgi:hypothetical protein
MNHLSELSAGRMVLNRALVRRQIEEAREQLEDLEARLKNGRRLSEDELEILLGHAYHHLNFAWNCRNVREEVYRSLTHSQFLKWGRVPLRVAENMVGRPRKKR